VRVSIAEVFPKILVLFLIIGIGFIANRCGVINQEGNRMLSKLVISVTFPAYVLGSAMSSTNASPASVFTMLGISFAHYALLFIIVAFLPKLLRVPKAQVGTYRFMFCFANTGFIGFPVVAAILGEEAIFTATMFNLPFNLLSYTIGVVMLSNTTGGKVKLDPKLFLTPTVIACVLAIFIALVPIRWPSLLINTCQTLGAVTTPAALIIIGSTIAGMPLKALAGSPRVYFMAFFRLVFMPLLCWAILRPILDDRMILGVVVVLAGMPVATNGTMLSLIYGGDTELMSQGTFLTTMLSLITIPLMALLLQI